MRQKMKLRKMYLFVWEGCFADYATGLGVVLAHDVDEARGLLRRSIGYDHPDIEGIDPDRYRVTRGPMAFYVHGGG